MDAGWIFLHMFSHFWTIFEVFPRNVELLSLCGIFYWAHDDIPLDLGPNFGNFSPVFGELPRWSVASQCWLGGQDWTDPDEDQDEEYSDDELYDYEKMMMRIITVLLLHIITTILT